MAEQKSIQGLLSPGYLYFYVMIRTMNNRMDILTTISKEFSKARRDKRDDSFLSREFFFFVFESETISNLETNLFVPEREGEGGEREVARHSGREQKREQLSSTPGSVSLS